ncbi:unnamed protein product [Ranitomeya imitator]|uniref:Helix-turn-helix domain-containing protein n=1 Tax=Ranitomeya imitator TaxID=111125 RepID=A0ABN9ML95_9NEOB|nr:unnamed protein product [Ranitomeya imitator]
MVLDTPGHSSVISWLRYIDDILLIWQGSASHLESFLCHLNNNIFNIKLTWKYSHTTVEVLDLQIFKLNDGSVSTDIFRKTTATNSLLHFTSSHPPKLKSSIPIGQFLRARRICSDDTAFHAQARDLRHRFKNRGYSRALYTNRSTLLSKSSCKKKTRAYVTPRFIAKFNSNWTEINQIFKKHWSVLLSDKDLQQQLTPYPSITWRRSRTLGDLLCQSHYVAPKKNLFATDSKGPPWGCFSCGKCSACRYILRTKEFTNAKGDEMFKIVHHITCDTEVVVYHASCPCGYIYVGMTTRSLKIRIQEHVRDIKNAITCSEPHLLKLIARHFFDIHGCNPKGLSVRGIDHVYMGIRGGNLKQKLLQKETRWIVTLDTLSPNGLNETISFKSFFLRMAGFTCMESSFDHMFTSQQNLPNASTTPQINSRRKQYYSTYKVREAIQSYKHEIINDLPHRTFEE